MLQGSKGSILQYFWPSLSYRLLLRLLFVYFWVVAFKKMGFTVTKKIPYTCFVKLHKHAYLGTHRHTPGWDQDKQYSVHWIQLVAAEGGWVVKSTRIYHKCEGGIKKSVPRITDWHHEACWVMKIGDREGQIFLSHPHTNNGLFFLLTT